MIAARINDMVTQVILTNPPWRMGVKREGAERKNAVYPRLRRRVAETYATRSRQYAIGLVRSLYDQYIQAIRIASDKIGDGGIIGFVANNGWLSSLSASGFRECLADEFDEVYVYNLRGNARTIGEAQKREGGGVFGNSTRAGGCMVLLVKRPVRSWQCVIRSYTVGDGLSRQEKLDLIRRHRSVANTPWRDISREDWIGRTSDKFNTLVPLSQVFALRTLGMVSNRDAYAFNPSREDLERHMRRLIATYNTHVERVKHGEITKRNIDERAERDESLIKWDDSLKSRLFTKGIGAFEKDGTIYRCSYRPFVGLCGYISGLFISRIGRSKAIHPTPDTPNLTLCVTAKGDTGLFTALATKRIGDSGLLSKAYLYPLYVYNQPAPDEDSQGG